MSLLDPSEYIPDPENEFSYIPQIPQPTFAQQGPMLAAQGNMGALQRLSMLDNNSANQLRERMMSRVRTPEQMDQALAQRRGALQSLNQEVLSPSDNASFFTDMMMHSSLARGKGTNWSDATTYSIGAALQDKRKREDMSKGDRIQAAKNNYDFEGVEDKAADVAESKAMSELSKIAVAQTKSDRAGVGGRGKTWTNVPGVGIVDLSQTGPDGRPVPKVLLSSENTAKMYEQFHKQYQILATNPQMEGQFSSAEEMTQWIKDQAQNALKQAIGRRGAPQEIIDQIPNLLNPANQEAAKRPTLATPGIVPDGTGLQGAVKLMESGGDPNAVSPKGAEGTMQVMPATQTDPGFGVKPAQSKDPAELERVGNDYLETMVKRYGNEIHGLAAYNWGPGNVDKWLAAGGDMRKLPTETRLYIADVLGTKQKGGKLVLGEPASEQAAEQQPAPGLTTSAQRAGQKKSAELLEQGGAEVMKQWQTERNQANDQLNTYSMIKALRPEIETGLTAPIREKLGAAFDAFGIKGGLPKEARNLQAVNKMIREQVNQRMTLEKGVQTEGDTQRFQQAYLNTQDTPYAFDLMLGMIKESSLRKQARAQLGEEHVAKSKSHANLQQQWENVRDKQLGPMLLQVGGKPMWRHEYIEKAIELNADSDPSAVEAYAAKKWLEMSRKGK